MVWPPNKKTRMSNAHWPKIMLSYNVTGVYSRGHPKKKQKKTMVRQHKQHEIIKKKSRASIQTSSCMNIMGNSNPKEDIHQRYLILIGRNKQDA